MWAEALRLRAQDYELLAEWHAERAPIDPASARSAVGFIVIAIALREVALALDAGQERWAA
jgi:hypothetical protein